MRIHESLIAAREAEIRRTVATLGVFDGVHVGHRFVIRECVSLALERAVESVVVTFREHPRAVIAGRPPKLITPIEQRLQLFKSLGVHHCLILEFDDDLRSIHAADFAHQVFEDILGAEIIVLGHNCCFGENREGSADFLLQRAAEFSFATRKAPEVRVGQTIMSSTTIRSAIETGDLELASTMLGRPYALFGQVVHGDKRGRSIGFPTANLNPHHGLLPPRGVYGCSARIDGHTHYAVTNIGVRPTFKSAVLEDIVEAHFLDYEGDLYERELELVFLVRIRDERKFDSVAALVAQIDQDRNSMRHYIGQGRLPGAEA